MSQFCEPILERLPSYLIGPILAEEHLNSFDEVWLDFLAIQGDSHCGRVWKLRIGLVANTEVDTKFSFDVTGHRIWRHRFFFLVVAVGKWMPADKYGDLWTALGGQYRHSGQAG